MGLPQTEGGINLPEVVYITVIVAVCLLTNIAHFKINTLVDFNGAVVGFCFLYLFPVMVHIKCSLSHGEEPEFAFQPEDLTGTYQEE